MTDNVNSPDHYARYRFECEPKDLTKYLPHPLASAIEYIIRAPFKGNEIEDLRKACFWLGEFARTNTPCFSGHPDPSPSLSPNVSLNGGKICFFEAPFWTTLHIATYQSQT